MRGAPYAPPLALPSPTTAAAPFHDAGTLVARRHAHRFQRHAADRAGAGLVADDLGMHRTGILRALRHRLWRRLAAEKFLRIGLELGFAPGGAEVKTFALIAHEVLGRGTLDFHPANRIGRLQKGFWLLLKFGPAAFRTK
ncbi:hypothetical protein MES5069_390030 [Mesorhizobium escarrei]|uniref:Uncharacterized protein n=1 Tax=Mesorhizobium escarrei TaxID=666018 RepID=A0ABM9E453_9HYPH|nr:hypothetical protein MES5069_390030 [Mesorhizobium escarrei]